MGRKREALEGYLFLAPWALGFVLFVAGPILASLVLSFTKYNVIRPPEFIGLGNYITALTKDDILFPSIGRTFYYAALVVPIGLALIGKPAPDPRSEQGTSRMKERRRPLDDVIHWQHW